MPKEQDVKSAICAQKDGEKISDEELNKVSGGNKVYGCCPNCKSSNKYWSNGKWICNKCHFIW